MFKLTILFFLPQLENNLERAKKNDDLRQQPELKDKMHGLIFVINSEQFSLIDENILKKFMKIRNAANDRGKLRQC